MNQYRYLDKVNSQKSEQRNRELRKFSSRLAKMKFTTYVRWIELWFAYINLKDKKSDKGAQFLNKLLNGFVCYYYPYFVDCKDLLACNITGQCTMGSGQHRFIT